MVARWRKDQDTASPSTSWVSNRHYFVFFHFWKPLLEGKHQRLGKEKEECKDGSLPHEECRGKP